MLAVTRHVELKKICGSAEVILELHLIILESIFVYTNLFD